MSKIGGSVDEYGFTWGPAQVTRVCDRGNGGVIMAVTTARTQVEIHVTKTGIVRVFDRSGSKYKGTWKLEKESA